MNLKRRHLTYFFIAIVDMAIIICSYFLASFVYLGDPLVPNQLVNARILSWRDSGILFLIIYSLCLVLGYVAVRVFGSIYLGHIKKMVKGVVLVNLIGLVLFTSSFYVFDLDNASRILVVLFFAFSTIFVCCANWIAIHIFRLRRNSQKHRRNVIVVGSGHIAREYAEAVGVRSSRLEHVLGHVVPYANYWYTQQNNPNIANFGTGTQRFGQTYSSIQNESESKDYLGPCLGTVYDLEAVCSSHDIDEIVLALDVEDYACAKFVVSIADKKGTGLTLIPFYNDIIPNNPNIDSFGDVSVVDLRSMPLSNPIYASLKRLFDIITSLLVIVLTSWIMVITAIGVKISSPGPVFFRQLRVGRGNKPFEMLKFRSMSINDESETAWSTNEDPRKTRFGSFIRKYSIDELPQFFNVLKGDMSIVGPRPEISFFVQQFSESIPLYMLRHQVRPGITGLAQISGLRGDTSIRERIELDLNYIQHWTFWLDIKIFFKTLFGGFVNDEVLVESGLVSRIKKTKFGSICLKIYESSTEGILSKAFNFVYLSMLFVYVFFIIYGNTFQEIIPGVTPYIAFLICSYCITILTYFALLLWICEGRKLLFWVIAIICYFLMIEIMNKSGIASLVAIYAFVFAFPKTLKLEKTAKIMFLSFLLIISLIVVNALLGNLPDYVTERGHGYRHSLGFLGANALATTVTVALIPYVYFRLHNWKWFDAAFCILIGGIVFVVAQGRMSFAMLLFMVVLACICRFSSVKKLLSSIAPWIVPVCFVAVIFTTIMYWQGPETPFSSYLNQVFSGRFEYISSYYDECKITLFGQTLSGISSAEVHANPDLTWRGIDCSYVSILLRMGIIGTLIMLICSIWLGKRAETENYFAVIFLIAVIAIFSITENFFYNPYQNFGIFMMGYFLAAWATKKDLLPERASAPIDKSIDWVNIKGSRWRDFLIED